MKGRAALAAPALALAGCQPGASLDVKVMAPDAIMFTLDETECIENLRITRAGEDGDDPAQWEVEGDFARPSPSGAPEVDNPPCLKQLRFPLVPDGFTLTSTPRGELAPGEYKVTGKAGIYWLSGDFTVPAR